MGVKWKTKKNKFPEMERAAAELNGRWVNVGVFGGGMNEYIASIHEYGCKIKVTDKMRAYLHRQGLHLKASTEYITIPERAFLRTGYDQGKDEVINMAESIMCDVLSGHMPLDMYLGLVGQWMVDHIRDYATSLDSPPNHPFTTERKGSSNPLVDTGDMIGAITYRVE